MDREKISATDLEKLVSRAQRGCEKSFGMLFDFFFEKIARYVRFRVQETEVEDVTSDIFLKVVENIQSYQKAPRAGFSSWIFRIAHNTVIDFYRRKKEVLAPENDDDEEGFFLQIPDENPTPDMETDHHFNTKRIHQMLGQLPSNQREILELKYLEGFSNTEIAQVTGKSEGNVRVLQLRALREMRTLWNENNDQ